MFVGITNSMPICFIRNRELNINLLTEEQRQQLSLLLSNTRKAVVVCHKSPDGDALGSSLSWAAYMQLKGVEINVVVPDAYPDFLQWMPMSDSIVRFDKKPDVAEEMIKAADTIFCLDFNTMSRLSSLQTVLEQSIAQKILIDHHENPDVDAVMSISFPRMSSTSEMVFRLIWQLGDYNEITLAMAKLIYTGMMTDTGGFTYNSNDPAIFFIVSQLLALGFDKDLIYRKVYNNYSDWAIRFRGYILYQKMNYISDKHASFFSITKEEMSRFHFIKGDAEGLVNEPLRIRGVRLSISLREDTEKNNLIWVSLRSIGNFHCDAIAQEFFNGGGHHNAAGGKLMCSMDEAVAITKKAIDAFHRKYFQV